MLEYEVRPRTAPLNFNPLPVVDEVLQNVATLLATVRYSVPHDREMGINPDYLDDPMPQTQARATADIIRAIRRYEPRAQIVSVDFEGDGAEGIMRPIVRVKVYG